MTGATVGMLPHPYAVVLQYNIVSAGARRGTGSLALHYVAYLKQVHCMRNMRSRGN